MRAAKKHLVDGRWVTVKEMAGELGVKCQQLYNTRSYYGVGLQGAVNMIRENQALNGLHGAHRWMVDGKWTTVRQAAEMLGVSECAIRCRMHQHPRPDGGPAPLQEAVDYYRRGENEKTGRRAALHRVGGRKTTIKAEAARLGISPVSIRTHMCRTGESLAQTVRYYERRARAKAEKEIMAILSGG